MVSYIVQCLQNDSFRPTLCNGGGPGHLCSEKIHYLQPTAKIKKFSAENRKANQKHEQQQSRVS